MRAFIDAQRERFGVEPICRALQVAPSGYRRHAARLRDSSLLPARAQRDAVLVDQVERVHRALVQISSAVERDALRVALFMRSALPPKLRAQLGP